VNLSVLEFVFLLSVENDAVLIQVAHNGRLPTWATQEIDDDVKEPVLKVSIDQYEFGIHFQTQAAVAYSSPLKVVDFYF
jgi:hypothetical protein